MTRGGSRTQRHPDGSAFRGRRLVRRSANPRVGGILWDGDSIYTSTELHPFIGQFVEVVVEEYWGTPVVLIPVPGSPYRPRRITFT